MIVDFAERAHNHNWDLDPVVRSLLDTDFYKLLMLQFIWKHFPTTQVSFSVSNRSSSVRLADVIAKEEVLQQLEHVRSLRFLKSELIWPATLSSAVAASSSRISWTGWLTASASRAIGSQ
jgi:nicotinate phosphoribosyltransferase